MARDRERFVLFRLGGRLFAVECASLIGMVQAESALNSLTAERANWQGERVPVIRPHESLGLPAAKINSRSCLMIVEQSEIAGPALWAVLVDSVSREVDVDKRHVTQEAGARWIKIAARRCQVLNLVQLVAAKAHAA